MSADSEVRSWTFKKPEPTALLDHNTECTARVKAAEFTMSNAGNDMVVVETELVGEDGQVLRTLKDHLAFTEKAEWKLNQFAASIGLASESGQEVSFSEESLVGKSGRVRVTQETWVDGTGKEVVSNRIGSWLEAAA